MRKLLIGLAAVAVVIAFAAADYASAASVKMTGLVRARGLSHRDTDRDSRSSAVNGAPDGIQQMQMGFRPRWTITSLKGKIKAVYELDFTNDGGSCGNFAASLAAGGTRCAVGTNRYALDFAIPGTKSRFRIGKSDWTAPGAGRELVGGAGLNRVTGMGFYGKLGKGLSYTAWNSQRADGGAAASDDNDYLASVSFKAAGVKLSPWIGFEHFNSARDGVAAAVPTNATTKRKIYWYGLSADAKMGKLSLSGVGVLVNGELDFGTAINNAGTQNTDIEGYAVLLRSWLNLGRGLKVGLFGTFMPGDDDTTSAAGDFGTQPDNKITRYVPMNGGGTAGTCRINGPQMLTRRRYHSQGTGYDGEVRCGNGIGGAGLNGSQIIEFLVDYKMTKKVRIRGNYSFIRSAASRPTTGGVTFSDSKDAGSEIDITLSYTIAKKLSMDMTYSHLFAGDYGLQTGNRNFDDSWAATWRVTHTF